MPDMTDKRKPHHGADRTLEEATISRPNWALDHVHHPKTETDTKVIPKDFLDALLEVVAKTIEQTLADIMARCVGEGVERSIRPLAEEVALLRVAIEHDWDNGHRRRRTTISEPEEPPEE
jgi:hypothetical protein